LFNFEVHINGPLTMKKTILLLMFTLLTNIAFGQNKEEAEKLVNEGISYHDKGDYDGAIAKYDRALMLDKDNLFALSEKSFSLTSQQKFDEAITYCKKAIEKHPGDEGLVTTYVTYGNALDGLKKTDQSIEIYDEGLKLFPNNYQLHFNKGITLLSVKRNDEAILCFQKAATKNPSHASSHSLIGRLLNASNKRIPSLLAYSRFLVLEPQSQRAKENLESVRGLMKANVEKTGKKSVTITISPEMLGDTTKGAKPKENSFSSTDLILSMVAALDYDKENKDKTEVEQFIRKFESVCTSLKETRNDNFGFYWDYYVPYFTEMKDQNLIETFAYIAFASSEDPEVAKWLNANKSAIDKFYDWSKKYSWK